MSNLIDDRKLQRAKGSMILHKCGNKLERLYQSGCAKIMLPKTYGNMMEAVLLNTAGGMTGGDQLNTVVKVEDCAVVVTTQTPERLYRSTNSYAEININISVSKGATFHWLPQETIVFDGAKLNRTIQLDMSSDSKCLTAETIMLGRQAMGECVKCCHLNDQWRLTRDGTLFHAEALRLSDLIKDTIKAKAGADDARYLSTIVYAGLDAETKYKLVQPTLEGAKSLLGVSCWQNKLVIRLISAHAPSGRSAVNKLLTAIRQMPLPRVWQ